MVEVEDSLEDERLEDVVEESLDEVELETRIDSVVDVDDWTLVTGDTVVVVVVVSFDEELATELLELITLDTLLDVKVLLTDDAVPFLI